MWNGVILVGLMSGLLSIRSCYNRSSANEQACNCLLRHAIILRSWNNPTWQLVQFLRLFWIKLNLESDGPGAVKFDSNWLFCKLCCSLIIVHWFCLDILCSYSLSAPLQVIKYSGDNKNETIESIQNDRKIDPSLHYCTGYSVLIPS